MRLRPACGSCSRLRPVTNVGRTSLSSGFGPARLAGLSTSVARTMCTSPGRLALGSFEALSLEAFDQSAGFSLLTE